MAKQESLMEAKTRISEAVKAEWNTDERWFNSLAGTEVPSLAKERVPKHYDPATGYLVAKRK